MALATAERIDQVSDELLTRYAQLIYSRTGIRVSPQKKMLLSNRLRRRLRATGIAGFEEYYAHLGRLKATDPEWDAFLQEITTHETYLFRDKAHWDWLRREYLPQRVAAARAGQQAASLRIWSAAASTGDEAYTVACSLAACLPDCPRWKIQILGTDIGIGAIEQARAGVFGERAMRLVPDGERRAWFAKARDANLWEASPTLKKMVTFRQHNLLEPLREQPFDVVFLKNVLIYFDRESKKRVTANVQAMVRPGGALVAGAAEGVSDLMGSLKHVSSWLYLRPLR